MSEQSFLLQTSSDLLLSASPEESAGAMVIIGKPLLSCYADPLEYIVIFLNSLGFVPVS